MSSGEMNVCDFGAVGDGRTDNTAAFQKALDAAAGKQAGVFVPAGDYVTSTLKLHPNTGLFAHPTWKYNQRNKPATGTILRLRDKNAPCLLDLSGAVGATVSGLALYGLNVWDGQNRPPASGGAHGIMVRKDKGLGEEEDIIRIERCRISHFAGDGIHFEGIWCCNVRHNLVIFNGGHGLRANGCDGFVLDNWLSSNAGAGICTDGFGACFTITANRIEWNRRGGIVISAGKHYNITGNFIDRSGQSGINIISLPQRTSEVFTITGNIIWRSGRPEWVSDDPYDSSQVRLDDVYGLVMTGNSFNVWRDDGPRGEFSPRFGIVYRALHASLIKDNVLHGGAVEKLVVDLGGNDPDVIVGDNPGTLFTHPDMGKQARGPTP